MPPSPEPSVPATALQQFLHYLRERQLVKAKALAFRILTDEPDNETVWRALPMINKQLEAQEKEAAAPEQDEEDGDEEDGEEDGEEEME